MRSCCLSRAVPDLARWRTRRHHYLAAVPYRRGPDHQIRSCGRGQEPRLLVHSRCAAVPVASAITDNDWGLRPAIFLVRRSAVAVRDGNGDGNTGRHCVQRPRRRGAGWRRAWCGWRRTAGPTAAGQGWSSRSFAAALGSMRFDHACSAGSRSRSGRAYSGNQASAAQPGTRVRIRAARLPGTEPVMRIAT